MVGVLLQIQLLGDFALAIGGQPLTALNSPRLQSLFAYLLLHRDAPQPRHHIAFLFWPDSSEMQAQTNLRNLILVLKRDFSAAEDYIAITRRELSWRNNSPFALDVARFERALAGAGDDLAALQRAADLYGGDLLPGCYDAWAVAPRERLSEQYQLLLERLVRLLERDGDLGAALIYAQRLLRQDPLREENYRRLMALHLANGDRAGVLNVYKQCVRTLKHELGVAPGPDIAALLEQAKTSPARRPAQISTPTQATGWVVLPAQTTIFFGRERELAALRSLLLRPDVRLVTLTGAAGTGKTRLAISVAASLVNSFPDGVCFVSLAALADPAAVGAALSGALGLVEPVGGDLLDQLARHIGSRRVLLLLDNFEHLLAAVPTLADLLARCPHLKLLVTSRAVLNLRGEHEFGVAPLPVPPRDAPPRPDELLQYEAVALFVDRAVQVSPGFAINSANARSIVEICRKVDGLPLAIELAAARVKVLAPAAILSRLDRRLKLLVGGPLDLPARQRALETAIAWSYQLLDEGERRFFRALALFEGGFSAAAVGEIQAVPDALAALAALLDKSLIIRVEADAAEEENGDARFNMLETLKEYAWAQMLDAGESAAASLRHASYFAALAEQAAGELDGPHQQEWLHRLDQEHDNLRVALRRTIEADQADLALRIGGALGLFWERRGYLSEGRQWLGQALALPGAAASPYRATATYYCGVLAVRQRHYESAAPLLRESLELYQQADDLAGMSNALSSLAVMTVDQNYPEAVALHLESLRLRRLLGDEPGIARTLQNLGFIKMHQGEWAEAAELTGEAHRLYQKIGSPVGISYTLYVLAMIAAGQGDPRLARERFDECLVISSGIGNDWLTAWALHGLAEALHRAADYTASREKLDAAQELFVALGDRLGLAYVLVSRGRDAYRLGEDRLAERHFRAAAELGRELNNSGIVAASIAGFAALWGRAGDLSRAAFLYGCASDLVGSQFTTLDRWLMTLDMDELHRALDHAMPGAWDAEWLRGSDTHWRDALAIALA